MPREIARKPRFIYPTVATSLSLSNVSALAELLFWRILPQADDQGRLTGHPKQLKAQACPMRDEITEDNIPQLLNELEEANLIIQYTASSEPLLQIKTWWSYQYGMKRIYPSKYLPPEGWEDRVKGMKETSGGQKETSGGQKETSGGQKETSGPIVPPISGNQVIRKSGNQEIPHRGLSGLKEQPNPKKQTQKKTDSQVAEIFVEMRATLGYPDKTEKDPIPSYGKEGQAIKRMLARGFTREEVIGCWKQKVDARGGEFVSMTWVNEDIGKIRKSRGRRLPTNEERERSLK